MRYWHHALEAGPDRTIEITLDKAANVKLMDEENFNRYRRRQRHRFYGGRARRSPVHLRVPRHGRWHLIVDRGGLGGTVHGSVRLI
jgi:hypothetical protein